MTALCVSRPIGSFSCGPATEGIAAFTDSEPPQAALTDSELPQVEKNACSAPTAPAISSSARFKDPLGRGPVVRTGHREHVGAEESLTQHSPDPWVGSPVLLVAGRRERQLLLRLVGPHSVEHGSRRVVHGVWLPGQPRENRYAWIARGADTDSGENAGARPQQHGSKSPDLPPVSRHAARTGARARSVPAAPVTGQG